jgi:nucleotide-binding universal stress UspA family protein
MTRSGPVLIGFDGTPASENAVRESAALLAPRRALVLVVHHAGLGFDAVALPTVAGLPPAQLDVRTALEIDRTAAEGAQRLAQQGAALAREAGFDAEGQAVADDLDTPVDQTILNVADERDAAAIVLGAHGHGALSEIIIGSTTRGVIRRATRPVVVVRHAQG